MYVNRGRMLGEAFADPIFMFHNLSFLIFASGDTSQTKKEHQYGQHNYKILNHIILLYLFKAVLLTF